jgi:hypothetical protein
MAYYNEYDQLVETDEERRKREEEALKKAGETPVAKTEVTKYEDGSQTHTTTQEIPSPAQGVQPSQGMFGNIGQRINEMPQSFVRNVQQAGTNFVNNVQQAPENFVRNIQAIPGQIQQKLTAGPVAPDQTYNRMLQVESGNKDYLPNGQPVTSSKGAMFAGQVMPATAANPGYGIRPAQAQTPEEYNRVGQEYYQAMLQKFGGDTQKAAAAYNAGPGRVQQNIQQNQGQLNIGQLPQETQNYLQKVSMPIQPVNPQQVAQQVAQPSAYSLSTGVNPIGLGTQQQRMEQPVVVDKTQAGISAYQTAQNDIPSLLKLSTDENQPEFIRQRSGDQAMQLYKNKRDEQTATEKLSTLTPKQIADVAQGRDKSSVGDWLQYLLFKHVGLTDLANEKGDQLGIGHKWQGAMDSQGNAGMIQYTVSGKPLMGIKEDGTQMSPAELTAYASMGDSKNIHVGATPHHGIVNGETHTFATRTVNGQMQYKDSSVPDSKWSTKAPEGFSTLGYQDPQHLKGLSAASSVSTKMEKANADAMAVGGRPLYTPQQIADAKNSAYMGMTGKPFPGMNAPISNAPVANAPAVNAPVANAPVANAPAVNAPVANAPKSQAQSILDYESPPPVGPSTPAKIAIMNEVQRLAAAQGKTFSAGNFKIASNFNNSPSGKALKSINVAVDHLDTLQEAANELKNGQTPAFNKIANLYATNTGSVAPGNFDALKSIVGAEVAKAVTGGASALGDREEIRKEIENSKTPEQLAGIIGKLQALMAGQAKGIRQEWVSSGLDENSFDNKLMPRTKVVLNKQKEPSRSKW